MKPRILVVDDEAAIRNMLAFSLNRADMEVELACSGDEALARLREARRPDLVVMDWMMPGLDGLQVTRRLREAPDLDRIPVILLTACGKETDRARGLDSGADDYVVKPFSTLELISRVRAVLRRTRRNGETRRVERLCVGDLVLDPEAHRALAGDRPVPLGPTEYRLLERFMRTPGRAWSRRQLLQELWGSDRAVEERTVDVHIRRLRKALEPTGLHRYVQTVRGLGYRFSDVI